MITKKEVEKIFGKILEYKRENPKEMVPAGMVIGFPGEEPVCVNLSELFVSSESKRLVMIFMGEAVKKMEEEKRKKINEVGLLSEMWFTILPKDADKKEYLAPSVSPNRIDGIMISISKDKGKHKIYCKRVVEKKGEICFEDNEGFGGGVSGGESVLFDNFWNSYYGLVEL